MNRLIQVTKMRVNGNDIFVPSGQAETILRHLGIKIENVTIQYEDMSDGGVYAIVSPRDSGSKGSFDEELEDVEGVEEEEIDIIAVLRNQKPSNYNLYQHENVSALVPNHISRRDALRMLKFGFTGVTPEQLAEMTVGQWDDLCESFKYKGLAELLNKQDHTPESAKDLVITLAEFLA